MSDETENLVFPLLRREDFTLELEATAIPGEHSHQLLVNGTPVPLSCSELFSVRSTLDTVTALTSRSDPTPLVEYWKSQLQRSEE